MIPETMVKGCWLVPVDLDSKKYGKVSRTVPPGTYRRVSKAGKLKCLVTFMPDGIEVAWDYCGGCALGVRACICVVGVTAPSSIKHIYGPYRVVPDPVRVLPLRKPAKPLSKPAKPTATPLRRPKNQLPSELTLPLVKPRKHLMRPLSMHEIDAVAEGTADDLLDLALRKLKKGGR